MRRLILLIAAVLALAPLPAAAQQSTTAQPCTGSAIYDNTTSGATRIVTAREVGGIYVCGYTLFSSGGGATVKLIYGTGTNCGTGSVNLTPAFPISPQVGIIEASPYFRGMYVPPSNDLCISVSGVSSLQAIVYFSYAQQR